MSNKIKPLIIKKEFLYPMYQDNNINSKNREI
jgi:hypothetical protein